MPFGDATRISLLVPIMTTIQCKPYRIDTVTGEIRAARHGDGHGAYIHVDDAPVIEALEAACAIPLPVRGRYAVNYQALREEMAAGRRIVATRFER